MEVRVWPAGAADRIILERLLQLYQHDLSETEGWPLGPDGRYSHFDLAAFVDHPSARPFLIGVDAELAGFALVLDWGDERELYEFFIVRKLRRRRVGERAASMLFDRFPGRWEVKQTAANVASRAFWRAVIGRYT